jgi:hypothetical protein
MDSGSGFTLTEALVVAAVGFGGVLTGSLLSILAEMWREVHRARSSTRIVRMEMNANLNKSIQAVALKNPGVELLNDAWKRFCGDMADLIPDEALSGISTNYEALFIIQKAISQIGQRGLRPEELNGIREWQRRTIIDSAFLLQLQRRRRLAHLMDMLFGRATFVTKKPMPEQVEKSLVSALTTLESNVKTMTNESEA